MFSAFQTFGRLGAGARAVASAWTPAALWPTGTEPGMWIDPSNLDASWQDSTDYVGMVPVSPPGSVADSSNPVGLALDLRLGAPDTLGPELVVNGDFSDGTTGWTGQNGGTATIVDGELQVTCADTFFAGVYQNITLVVGRAYLLRATLRTGTSPRAEVRIDYAASPYTSNQTDTELQVIFAAPYASNNVQLNPVAGFAGDTGYYSSISVREIPGNHLFQATSTARPLESAYDGQTLGPGDTYDATGFPIYQQYDGTDDGMATATFTAGTLSSAMDCMIAVRRDSGAKMFCGLYPVAGDISKYFANAEAGLDNPCFAGCGTPDVFVDGVQLTNGWASELYTAVTVGDWHIIEFRGLDLSTWSGLGVGNFGLGYNINGAQGGILLFPGGNTAGRDQARTWLGAKVGLTL